MTSRKLRIAWSASWLILLVLLLPDVEPAAGLGSKLVPPSRLILPMLIGMPLIAALPWIPTRYSTRTLLVATSLVAVVLGLIVYMVR